ncbi:hypothetical protein [Streptomyces neyagawaensis]|uniref:hypothetical protein n=1 Tax=Streptomyces neyagawaensis TaxID=42238 RepID=UPI0027E55478|nr:hypothetical protein [Streptomyces neyagawaensis]
MHAGRIGRLTPGGESTSYPLDPASGGPSLITPGPEGERRRAEGWEHLDGRIESRGRACAQVHF